MTRTRLSAAAAGLAVAAGSVIMLVALAAAPGPWLRGYVSEAGAAGQPFAIAYRSGLILLAFGVALLGAAFRSAGQGRRPQARAEPHRKTAALLRRLGSSPVTASLLGVAAVLAGTSGAVPCSNQCPLPPFEPTTVADVAHTAASIAGMAALAVTMLAVCFTGEPRATRRLAAVAASLTVPLGAALGLTMLLVGRGPLGATLERLLLFVAVSWLIGTSLLIALRTP